MTGTSGRRRAHEPTPERKLIAAKLRPVVSESNLCLATGGTESVGGVPITEAPR